MSLFQAREYWTFTPDLDEECDNGCLVVGNVDNSLDGSGTTLSPSLPPSLLLNSTLPPPPLLLSRLEISKFVSRRRCWGHGGDFGPGFRHFVSSFFPIFFYPMIVLLLIHPLGTKKSQIKS